MARFKRKQSGSVAGYFFTDPMIQEMKRHLNEVAINENTILVVRRYCKICGKKLSMSEDLYGSKHFNCEEKKVMKFFDGKL